MGRVRYRGAKQTPRRHSDTTTQGPQSSSQSNSVRGGGRVAANGGKYTTEPSWDESSPDSGSVIWNYDYPSSTADEPAFYSTDIRWSLIKQLVISRLFLLVFQFVINWVMVDYPTDAFKGVAVGSGEDGSAGDATAEPNGSAGAATSSNHSGLIEFALGGLARWDSQHFLHVAHYGYTWESQLAFQPAWPTVLRVLSHCVKRLPFLASLHPQSAMLLGGVVFNNVLFITNGLLLYRLVYQLTGDVHESVVAVYVYSLNPASIFLSGLYSEPLYIYFTFTAMLLLAKGYQGCRQTELASAFIFSLAFITRANGLLNVGYVAWPLLMESVMREVRDDERDKRWIAFEAGWMEVGKKVLLIARLPHLILCFLVMSLPLRIFSAFIQNQFCHTHAIYQGDASLTAYIQEHREELVLPGQMDNISWCPTITTNQSNGTAARTTSSGFLLPAFYTPVQEKYWQVEWFGYWQWRKLPFFLLAAPTIWIILLGWRDLLVGDDRRLEEIMVDRRTLLPFAIHSLFLTLAGVFLYNVEVSTRLLYTSSPFIYIVLARLMLRQISSSEEDEPQDSTLFATGGGEAVMLEELTRPALLPFLSNYVKRGPWQLAVFAYLIGYYVFGTMCHVNWLPYI